MKGNGIYRVIGLMSGTSLDGLDVAYCEFKFAKDEWNYRIRFAKTYPYSQEWKKKLSSAHLLSGEKLLQLHGEYGTYLGFVCSRFIKHFKIKHIDFIASHGHTVFHQPEKKLTFQLGDGASLHVATGLPVVFDFRTLDVALGGEGAPLVPMGDKLLFRKYDACLNLGGIANISMELLGRQKAFDVCFCNMSLNYLMNQSGKAFDRNGVGASKGNLYESLLSAITGVYSPYRQKRPSLSREMFAELMQPLLLKGGSVEDRLRTVCASVANEISLCLPPSKRRLSLLLTGGGTHNTFLVKVLKEKLKDRVNLILPPPEIIKFKEALIFAFLGVLRLRGETNVMKDVTGAKKDSCSGMVTGFH